MHGIRQIRLETLAYIGFSSNTPVVKLQIRDMTYRFELQPCCDPHVGVEYTSKHLVDALYSLVVAPPSEWTLQ